MKTKGHASEQGMTLTESMVALAIFGIALSYLAPQLLQQRLSTIRNDTRTGAVAVSQQVLDDLRRTNVTTLPNSGYTTTSSTYLGKDYSTTTFYCETAAHCGTNSRHIRAQVSFNGETVYQAETVYSQFQ